MADATFTRQDHEVECMDRRQNMREYVCLKLKPIIKQLNVYGWILGLFIAGLVGGGIWKNNVDAAQNEKLRSMKEIASIQHDEIIKRLNKLEELNEKKFNAILKALNNERKDIH